MSFRAKSRQQSDTKKKPNATSKCTLQEVEGKGLILTTKEPKKTINQPAIPPPQNPPQGEFLADEYVHNLQQQMYFLDAELRFLRDRTGVNEQDVPSVDSAIRRLRRAIAMHEEETNKKIESIEMNIEKMRIQSNEIDENAALNDLDRADEYERLELANQESAFVETTSPIRTKQILKEHIDNLDQFHHSQKDVLSKYVQQQEATREQQEKESHSTAEKIVLVGDQRKLLLNKLKQSYENRRKYQEDRDILQILGKEEVIQAPNMSISTIHSQNAKVKLELVAIQKSQEETRKQIADLLMKNNQLVSEINIIRSKVERGKSIKEEMEKKFEASLAKKRKKNMENKAKIEELRKQKKEVKNKIIEVSTNCNKGFSEINNIYSEIQVLNETIDFKKKQKSELESQQDGAKQEIELITSEISALRNEIDQIATEIAEADEERKKLETLVEINKSDPKCSVLSPPAELTSLLRNLNAVKDAI